MNSEEIVKELRKRDKIFDKLDPRVVRRWIAHEQGQRPRWNDAVLNRAAKGNLPGGQGGRHGLLVSTMMQHPCRITDESAGIIPGRTQSHRGASLRHA